METANLGTTYSIAETVYTLTLQHKKANQQIIQFRFLDEKLQTVLPKMHNVVLL